MPPEPVIVSAAEYLEPGRALDLASGSGRNAIWLAERGWTITTVDREPAPALPDRHIVADLEKHEYTIEPDSWDLIVICRYLQRDLFAPAKRGVVSGGIIVAVVLLEGSTPGRFRMQRGELRTYFDDWEILHYAENGTAEIVGRKPGP
jgi:SAM-dependent methyltransferase